MLHRNGLLGALQSKLQANWPLTRFAATASAQGIVAYPFTDLDTALITLQRTVRTEMLDSVMRENPGHEKLFNDSNMLKRLARPEELNAAMLYLMSDASSYVTGNDILVDGGILGLLT
jgi:NAD(P)-dependent dehydrogenase (short-subunit alcohol dehydrogenase family)